MTTSSKGSDVTYTGDNTGNLLTKSDVGSYEYKHSVKKHAVTSIQNPSSSYQPSVESVTYTAFNKVNDIEQTLNGIAKKIEFSYGAGHARKLSRLYESGAKKETNYYTGSNYEVNKKQSSGVEKHCHYISAPSGLAAVFISSGSTTGDLYFVHTDYLGSVVGLSNQSGYIAEEYAYDAWGNRRSPGNWALTDNRTDFLINRGYTMHEHMNGFGLINMNGRVYDPKVGRFLSPDPVLQDPGNTQNMNRYSYAWNNPLKYTDPSGYTSRPADRIDNYSETGQVSSGSANWYGTGGGGTMSWNLGTIYNYDGSLNIAGPSYEDLYIEGPTGNWVRKSDLQKDVVARYVSKDAYTSVGAQRYYKGSSLHLVRESKGVYFMQAEGRIAAPIGELLGITGSIQAGLIFDTNFNISAFVTPSGGICCGGGAFAGVSAGSFPNAKSIREVSKWGFDVGAIYSVGPKGWSLEGDVAIIGNNDARLGATVSILGYGWGAAGYLEGSYMFMTEPINIKSMSSESFANFLNSNIPNSSYTPSDALQIFSYIFNTINQ
ncbi:RHS repeat-associated core domain-containing protein [Labilibaculum sp. K2S]|uniref:RHS repeat domain-containing protein n=1 Tax=Labilibaculum sp. K2S TaxID=3056386 RepID=UPI0025A473D9|nr:RHS repeat-associated core domain-containing protein [Labilibaculum sp. K2S]MDM8160146.1 RHS repeat-associated core domain-containing protein [Labilibaculum sp. K2S]